MKNDKTDFTQGRILPKLAFFMLPILGALVLIPCMFLLDKVNGKKKNNVLSEAKPETGKTLIFGGICCGTALFVASNLQQFGIQYTSVGKAGFITAMYIVLVPVLGIFLKKKSGAAHLVRCCACSGGTVSFVHDRRDFRQFWRCASAACVLLPLRYIF